MKRKLITIIILLIFFGVGNGIVLADPGIDAGNLSPAETEAALQEASTKAMEWQPTYEERNAADQAALDRITPKEDSTVWGGGSSDLSSNAFKLETSNFSPSSQPDRYNKGTKMNLTNFLGNMGKTLLIAISTLAVLSITIGGLMIATTGPSDRAAKGKTIISVNIIAIIIALSSYSIIQLARWLFGI